MWSFGHLCFSLLRHCFTNDYLYNVISKLVTVSKGTWYLVLCLLVYYVSTTIFSHIRVRVHHSDAHHCSPATNAQQSVVVRWPDMAATPLQCIYDKTGKAWTLACPRTVDDTDDTSILVRVIAPDKEGFMTHFLITDTSLYGLEHAI